MKYMFLIYEAESAEEYDPDRLAQYGAFSEDVVSKGIMAGGARLRPTDAATTVRVRNSETLTTDGPFAETKEALGGFFILECADLDEAIGYAARIPSSVVGSIEVRPVWE